MPIATPPENELARLRLLRSLNILDTPPEESFDRVVRIVAELTRVPTAMVSLVDEDRQWFKAKVGLDACQTPRDVAFCAHALHEPDILIVEDASEDERFADNPLVLGDPKVRFYAGVPLRNAEGLTLGTLCAIDYQPKTLSASVISAFKDLARVLERELLQRSAAADSKQVWEQEREAKQLSDSRFRLIFDETPTGKAIVDLDGQFIEVNAKFCEITGYSSHQLTKMTFKDITYEEDLAQDMSLLKALRDGTRRSYQLDKRYACEDGSLIWVQVNVALVRDSAGQPLHYIAVVIDISERKRSEALVYDYQHHLESKVARRTEELARSMDALQTITDNLPVLIAQVDQELRYVFNNDVYRQVFGIDPRALRGRRIADVLSVELFAELEPYLLRALSGERVTYDNVRYSASPNRVWSATYIPDLRNGVVQGLLIMSQDVTERRLFERSLIDEAMLDPLTQLPNRRALDKELAAILSQQERKPFAVFFMDLDGFKLVNDQHGHDAGDELLKGVAERLKQTMRRDDLIYRFAGDEFVAVAHGVTGKDTAARIAEDLGKALLKPFGMSCGLVQIGSSIGVTICPPGIDISGDQLLQHSDTAMYEAKRGGRNGFRFRECGGT